MNSAIIHNAQQWASLKRALSTRLGDAPHDPITDKPQKYPVLVVSAILVRGGKFFVENRFFYKESLQALLKDS